MAIRALNPLRRRILRAGVNPHQAVTLFFSLACKDLVYTHREEDEKRVNPRKGLISINCYFILLLLNHTYLGGLPPAGPDSGLGSDFDLFF